MKIIKTDEIMKAIEKYNLYHEISGFFDDELTIYFNKEIKDEYTFYKLANIPPPEGKKLQKQENYNPDIFIGIRSKNYLFVDSNDTKNPMTMKGKGVPKHVLKKIAGYEQFKDVIERKVDLIEAPFYTLQSKQNKYRLIFQKKVALSAYDDKTFFTDNYSFKYFGSI